MVSPSSPNGYRKVTSGEIFHTDAACHGKVAFWDQSEVISITELDSRFPRVPDPVPLTNFQNRSFNLCK
jgi:hypothetical protein